MGYWVRRGNDRRMDLYEVRRECMDTGWAQGDTEGANVRVKRRKKKIVQTKNVDSVKDSESAKRRQEATNLRNKRHIISSNPSLDE